MKSSKPKMLSLVTGAILAGGIFLLPRTAQANVGGDLDWALPVDSRANNGWGFGIRLGKEFHVPLVAFTPELGFWYYNFGGTFGNKMYEGKAGARLGIGEIIRVGAFGHFGFANSVPEIGDGHWGAAYDVGAFLDLTAIPLLNLGIHGAYNGLTVGNLSGSGSSRWFTVGLHADLVF